MSKYLGDVIEDDTIYFSFTSHKADGTPITLAGTPVLSVYKDDNATPSTAGITLTVDHNSTTGLNNVKIILTDAFYVTSSNYSVVITTGTVDGVSVVGYEVAYFPIQNRFPQKVDIAKSFKDTDVANTNPVTGSLFEDVIGPGTTEELQERSFITSALINRLENGRERRFIVLYTQDGAKDGATARTYGSEILGALIGGFDDTETGERILLSILGSYFQDGAGNITEIQGNAAELGVTATLDLSQVTSPVAWTGPSDENAASVAGYTFILTFVDGWNPLDSNQDVRIIYPRGIGQTVLDSNLSPSAASVADAVWDELKAGHTTANSYGKIVPDIKTDTAAIKLKTDTRPDGFKKNEATLIEFLMVDGVDHVTPKTGLTSVSPFFSLDGGVTFTAMSGSVTETAKGWYKISAVASEMNADKIKFVFEATGADATNIWIKTDD